MSRTPLVVGVCLLLSCPSPLPAWSPLLSRPAEPPTVRFPVDAARAGRLREAAQFVQKQQWPEAVGALRAILDAPDSGLCQTTTVAPDGSITWISARAEAARLLGTLPPPVLADFKRLSEPAAQELLRSARDKDDPSLFLEVVTRYPCSEARLDAAELLAVRAVEQGQYHAAARWFALLLDQPARADRLSALALYQATVAFCFATDVVHAERAWKRLAIKLGEKPVRVEGRLLRLDELKKDVERVTASAADWPLQRGDAMRTAPARGGVPLLQASWSVSTLPTPGPPYDGKAENRAWVNDYLTQALAHLKKRGLPILPAFHPIASKGRVVFRTYEGVFLVNLREPNPSPDYRHMWQHNDGGAAPLLNDPNKKTTLDLWKAAYLKSGPHGLLFENSIAGSVVSDGQRVILVDDLLLPPNLREQMRFLGQRQRPNFGQLQEQVYHNSLKAYDLDNFKLLWDLGRRGFETTPELAAALGLIPLHGPPANGVFVPGSYFLGPPLPLGGQLYVLHEKGDEVQLLSLAARDRSAERTPPPPDLLWSLPLLTVRDPIAWNPLRRVHAAHLASSDGSLVCPTNAGALVGVDAATQRVVWVYRYSVRPPAEAEAAALVDEWKVAAPAIVNGKVIFTSPDSPALHCLDLRDGRLLWQVPRAADDCYFAGVFDGKVVIVSRNSVRALDLVRGTVAWKLDDTGMPSGQGVADGNMYYLPVRGKAPGIRAIDLSKGVMVAHIKSLAKDAALGNLIFYEGQLLSQTLTDLSSFPLVKPRAK